VAALQEKGCVEASTEFPGGARLQYVIALDSAAQTMTASFEDGELRVALPDEAGREWASSGEISLRGDASLDDGRLGILVEKDFACLTPREGEDESDLYPHPQTGQATC
jgi:hypothetical protein